ncbi:class A beta-lactamase [Microbacterium sp. NPDC089695]|uniref:class A beta-lactamase n=1 Tax=Microbacterium sp. NPDC089695 TaxID=3364198 RepID=UPI0038199EC7
MTLDIRRSLTAAVAATALLALTACAPAAPAASPTPASETASATPAPSLSAAFEARFVALQEQFDRTLGVYAIDTGSGATIEFRADERFGFASTMKALSSGFVLANTTDAELSAPVEITADDVVDYSPVVEQHIGGSMTLLELADAAVRISDNAASNLLVRHLGGPEALEALLRDIGDTTTQVDRIEPELNDVSPGDDRDTSTPRALATSLADLALGDALTPDRAAILVDLLTRNTTGDALVRAGAPDGWTIGDKTGSAAFGTRNDIAIAWPPDGGAPILIAILSTSDDAEAETVDELIAEAAALVFEAFPTE